MRGKIGKGEWWKRFDFSEFHECLFRLVLCMRGSTTSWKSRRIDDAPLTMSRADLPSLQAIDLPPFQGPAALTRSHPLPRLARSQIPLHFLHDQQIFAPTLPAPSRMRSLTTFE